MRKKYATSIAIAWLCALSGLGRTPADAAGPTTMNAARPLPQLPQQIVDKAAAAPLFRCIRQANDFSNISGAGGANTVLAVAAFQGNTTADQPLLERIRFSILGENAILAAGGYWSQHERHNTAMYTLAKLTPRIWNELSSDEKHKIDLLMTASVVASAYTTADAAYVKGRTVTGIDGDTNLNRDWNPNYREGMIGAMLVGAIYFGGAAELHHVLDTYDHQRFVAQLRDAKLTNPLITFTWASAHSGPPPKGKRWKPAGEAPDGATIEKIIRDYRYYGSDLTDLMGLYGSLTRKTYGAKVSAGLNGGKGYKGYARLVSGAENLPNVGADGMLLEFNSGDALGPRSSGAYAYGGFRPNLTDHLVLLAAGAWKPGPTADECVRLMNVGVTDLFYKADHGYLDWSKGGPGKEPFDRSLPFDFEFSWALWHDVVAKYHASGSTVP